MATLKLTPPGPSGSRTRAAQARTRQHNGLVGEDVLEIHNVVCLHARVAQVEKIATPMVIVGTLGPGLFRARFAQKAGVDYRGKLLDGSGRAVFVEAKHVADAARRFDLGDVREVQRVQLDAADAAGCVAVLAVVRGPRRDLYALPWSEARRHGSLGDAELADWKVRPGEPYLSRWSR